MSRRLVLTGVRTSTGIVQGSTEMQQALAKKWQETFNGKSFDIGPAGTFLTNLELPQTDFTVERPSVEDYEFYFRKLTVSTCGPVGILYSGWRATGRTGAVTLHGYGEHLSSGHDPAPTFNYSSIVFAPKGELPEDAQAVIRAEQDTRPLSLKNSDNKIITGVHTWKFRKITQSNTHKYQRGFVAERSFLTNVVDLDSAARLYSMFAMHREYNFLQYPGATPTFALWDFCSAFPSVIHG